MGSTPRALLAEISTCRLGVWPGGAALVKPGAQGVVGQLADLVEVDALPAADGLDRVVKLDGNGDAMDRDVGGSEGEPEIVATILDLAGEDVGFTEEVFGAGVVLGAGRIDGCDEV
jgi:hypothetical protein